MTTFVINETKVGLLLKKKLHHVMNLSLPVNQTKQCPLVISKVTKWKWKMCLLRHCFDFERVRHATWLNEGVLKAILKTFERFFAGLC